jgi:hypothetical protein
MRTPVPNEEDRPACGSSGDSVTAARLVPTLDTALWREPAVQDPPRWSSRSSILTSTHDVLQEAGVTPVVLFSAHTLELEQAQAAGFRDLITKPFEIDILLQQVHVLLER